ncbi:MAG: PilZ domain-containing protein [Syntrophobacterales bacterium]|jgi:hypothetical protein
MPFKEKREYSRMQVVWPASIDTSRGPIEGEVISISLGGAFIQLEEMPDVAEALDLSMEIPEHHYAVFVSAEPVRFDVYESDDAPFSYGLGVRLRDLSREDFEFLSTNVLR